MARLSRISKIFRPLMLIAVLVLAFAVMPRPVIADSVDPQIAGVEVSAAFDQHPMTADDHGVPTHCHAPAGCAFNAVAESGGGLDDRHGTAWLAAPDAAQRGLRPAPSRHPPKRA